MNKEMKVNEKKMEKLYKAFNNKVYVFSALCNDYDQIKDNKKLSKTLKREVCKSLNKRSEKLGTRILNQFNEIRVLTDFEVKRLNWFNW
tara:strand:+ start:1407 stop:1673 length:267 start_codon:yes stop_codon:yes gene_type:complete